MTIRIYAINDALLTGKPIHLADLERYEDVINLFIVLAEEENEMFLLVDRDLLNENLEMCEDDKESNEYVMTKRILQRLEKLESEGLPVDSLVWGAL